MRKYENQPFPLVFREITVDDETLALKSIGALTDMYNMITIAKADFEYRYDEITIPYIRLGYEL